MQGSLQLYRKTARAPQLLWRSPPLVQNVPEESPSYANEVEQASRIDIPSQPSICPAHASTCSSHLPVPSIHPPTRELRNVFQHTWAIWSMCFDMLPKTYGMHDPKIVLTFCFQNVRTVRSYTDIPPIKHEYTVHGKLFPHNVWTDCTDHMWSGIESVGDCMVHIMYSRPSPKHPDSFPLTLNMQMQFS